VGEFVDFVAAQSHGMGPRASSNNLLKKLDPAQKV